MKGMRVKRGFTIVELMVVIAVIGILMAIVTNAALGALKNSRSRRRDAMRTAIEQGIAAFYAQEGHWPKKIDAVAEAGYSADTYTFTAQETDDILQEVVGRCFGKGGKKRIFLDPTSLYVENRNNIGNGHNGCYDNHAFPDDADTYCGNKKCRGIGVDFATAIAKSGPRHIRLNDMAFGYRGTEEGLFCRYWITYNLKGDFVSVSSTRPDSSVSSK